VIIPRVAALSEVGAAAELGALARDTGLEDEVRSACVSGLASPERFDDLLALARDETIEVAVPIARAARTAEMRVSVLASLGEAGDMRVLDALEGIVITDDDRVNAAAGEAIAQLRQRNS